MEGGWGCKAKWKLFGQRNDHVTSESIYRILEIFGKLRLRWALLCPGLFYICALTPPVVSCSPEREKPASSRQTGCFSPRNPPCH